MFRAKQKSQLPEETSGVPSVTTNQTVGRERLRHISGEVSKANEAVTDLEQRVARFNAIIADAETNHRNLQEAIHSDGGLELAKYSEGRADPNSEIAKLVTLAESSAQAANAARSALPSAEAMLANARAQVKELGDQRIKELNNVIAILADADARAYEKSFQETCRLHDKLVGYASTAQATIGDVQLILENPKVPRFGLPSLGSSDADPFLRHRPNDLIVAQSARVWSTVRQRLEFDVEADLEDLLS
jgi:hypothetical protein